MRVVALCVAMAIVLTGCDRWDGLSVRNDGEEPLRIVWQFPGGRENPVYVNTGDRSSRAGSPVAPGNIAEAGAIGGPPDPQPDIIVKAFSPSGTLVYCRRFTPNERNGMTSKNPLSLKPGDVRCS